LRTRRAARIADLALSIVTLLRPRLTPAPPIALTKRLLSIIGRRPAVNVRAKARPARPAPVGR
jgi:hypothetical protein